MYILSSKPLFFLENSRRKRVRSGVIPIYSSSTQKPFVRENEPYVCISKNCVFMKA